MDIFSIILYSVLPSIFYISLLYVIIPHHTFKLKTALIYWVGGLASVLLVIGFYKVIPQWVNLASSINNPFSDRLNYLHTMFFVQVGLLEESFKLVMFLILILIGYKVKWLKDITPIALMFYMGIIGLGFSAMENISYGMEAYNAANTLKIRSITAVPAHLVFGLYMGYFIAKGVSILKITHKSLIDYLLLKRTSLRVIIYTLFGLFVSTILHGIYNLHIALNQMAGVSGTYTFLFIATFGLYWCYKDLVKINSN